MLYNRCHEFISHAHLKLCVFRPTPASVLPRRTTSLLSVLLTWSFRCHILVISYGINELISIGFMYNILCLVRVIQIKEFLNFKG